MSLDKSIQSGKEHRRPYRGRNFVGIELDNKYFEIAKQRIERHMRQISMFDLVKESKYAQED